jgi:hypothetical protein
MSCLLSNIEDLILQYHRMKFQKLSWPLHLENTEAVTDDVNVNLKSVFRFKNISDFYTKI